MNRIFVVLVPIVLLLSCAKESDQSTTTGKVQFSVSTATGISSGLKSAGIDQAKKILITITDAAGNVIKDNESLALYNFGGELLSEPVSFSPGEYVLTKFLVADSTNNIIYATPVEGAELEYLVERPLPIALTISKDDVTKVTPEVISTEQAPAQDFGYSDFAFQVIGTFNFYVAVFIHNQVDNNLALTNAQLKVTSGTATLFDKELTAATAYPRLRDHYDTYTLEVSKQGYSTYRYTFTNDSLKKHLEDPLEVVLEKISEEVEVELVLQPGPEEGKDAYIGLYKSTTNNGNNENGNIFSWTYSGVMNGNRSLIDFNLFEIPENAIIESAKLSLYYNPTSVYIELVRAAPFWIRRIIEEWEEMTVTWATQPAFTTNNQVAIPQGESDRQDYPDMDVTALVQDMIVNPENSHGFILMFQDETPYKGIILASSDHPNPAIRPRLVVKYRIP